MKERKERTKTIVQYSISNKALLLSFLYSYSLQSKKKTLLIILSTPSSSYSGAYTYLYACTQCPIEQKCLPAMVRYPFPLSSIVTLNGFVFSLSPLFRRWSWWQAACKTIESSVRFRDEEKVRVITKKTAIEQISNSLFFLFNPLQAPFTLCCVYNVQNIIRCFPFSLSAVIYPRLGFTWWYILDCRLG